MSPDGSHRKSTHPPGRLPITPVTRARPRIHLLTVLLRAPAAGLRMRKGAARAEAFSRSDLRRYTRGNHHLSSTARTRRCHTLRSRARFGPCCWATQGGGGGRRTRPVKRSCVIQRYKRKM
eukprot:6187475-Pleurochrysis_carterae.AAC.1